MVPYTERQLADFNSVTVGRGPGKIQTGKAQGEQGIFMRYDMRLSLVAHGTFRHFRLTFAQGCK